MVTLTGANTYSGATTLAAGTLNANASAALGDGSATNTLIFTGGTLQAGGTITSPGTRGTTLTSTGIIDSNANAVSIAGVMGGAGGLTKNGAGTLTLSGNNTYAGTTTAAVGVIRLQSSTALGSVAGGTSVSSGAVLEFDGTGLAIAESVSISGNGITSAGAIRNITGTNSLTGGITLVAATRLNSDSGTLTIATGDISGAGQNLTIGGVGNTVVSSNITTTTGGLTKDGAGSLTLSGAGSSFTGTVALGNGTTSVSTLSNSGANSSLGAGSLITLGSGVAATLSYSGSTVSSNRPITVGGAGGGKIRMTAGGQTLTLSGAMTATAGTLTLDVGTSSINMKNSSNDFGTVLVTGGNAISVVDANALTLGASTMASLTAQTLSGDLTLAGNLTASGSGDSIVLSAAGNFNNSGTYSLNPGTGRWLVYSTSPAGSTEGALTAAAGSTLPRLYNRTYGGNPPGAVSESGNHLIYSFQPGLTVTPDNLSKVYGANDPTQTYTTSAFVTDDGVTDTATTAGLTSFARVAGESVGTRAITQGGFASNAGYGITFVTGNTLTVTQAGLTASVPNQSKTYGTDDPNLPIGVSLTGLVNRSVSTWNGSVTVNDSGLASNASALTRAGGENVGVYNITAGTFSVPSSNYSAPLFTGSPTLTINAANLTGSIADQSKIYGADDPLITGIAVTLGGAVNRTVSNWNGGSTVINDAGNVVAALKSLDRVAGETVSEGPYNFTNATFNSLTGSAGSNYAAMFKSGGKLSITPASLSVTADGKTKMAGEENPAFTASYSGLKFSESPSVLDGALKFATSAATFSPEGNYAITPSGLSSSNYSIGFSSGNMKIAASNLSSIPSAQNVLSKLNISDIQRSMLPDFITYANGTPIVFAQAPVIAANLNRVVNPDEIDSLPATASGNGLGGGAMPQRVFDRNVQCYGSTPIQAFSCR